MIETFKAFLEDHEAWDMYITGRAGTGKTTDVAKLVKYCLDIELDCVVTAYTHKAVSILAEKMPEGTEFATLHSFLGKRPTINDSALKTQHIERSMKIRETAKTSILFIDEYSMIGEKDLLDIIAAQDPDYDGKPKLKVVWVGDPYQLPPVGDIQAVKPCGDYQVLLTEIKRQAKDNPLGNILEQLVRNIEGEPPSPLEANENFLRDKDLMKSYVSCTTQDRVILAYTNKNVQELNELIQGYPEPQCGDTVYSPTTRKSYTFLGWDDRPTEIELPFGEPLVLNSKFKTLEHLIKNKTRFATLQTEEGDEATMACVFGHYSYKLDSDELKNIAAGSNKDIENAYRGYKAAGWAKANPKKPLARARAKAWRDFLSFNECTICLDFPHAMTVHKSQGSTYNTVFLDTDDLYKAAHFDFQMYLKLMYVALSRASNMVVTN